jgi:XapX domain-containing protein
MKSLLGLLLAFLLGAGCRWWGIPVPSPPKLLGALLVVATTMGYMAADRYLSKVVDGAKAEGRAIAPVSYAPRSAGAADPVPSGR